MKEQSIFILSLDSLKRLIKVMVMNLIRVTILYI